jgi:hypothetical protein
MYSVRSAAHDRVCTGQLSVLMANVRVDDGDVRCRGETCYVRLKAFLMLS